MNTVRSKLKSNRGASFIFALLGFMVAAVVSILIISSAVTVAIRVSDDVKAQQKRMTLSSAAELIRDELSACTCTITKKTSTDGGVNSVVYSAEGSDLNDLVKQAIQSLNSASSGQENEFTVRVKNGDEDLLDPVKVKLKISKNSNDLYQADATLSSDEGASVLYLTMTAGTNSSSSTETQDQRVIVTTTIITIKWDIKSAVIKNIEPTS